MQRAEINELIWGSLDNYEKKDSPGLSLSLLMSASLIVKPYAAGRTLSSIFFLFDCNNRYSIVQYMKATYFHRHGWRSTIQAQLNSSRVLARRLSFLS